ncbi:MAG: dihydrodipicolinate reductase [Limimaricola sp.]|uniref:dihydrodipicolinate reductase n=1 Tax=Limimaricola sp. TaxID=2211665 RepID=UPI001D28EE67|nr:dihydrodipicolinate reductase [Limimaricola sp.]MBI1416961.1 dihydrodipicolinate reductase [Limimaricola sp.]
MPRAALLALPLILSALPAKADGFMPVRDRQQFVSLVEGKELRIWLWGVNLRIRPDGTIEGQAATRTVSGRWAWQDGYFCREMAWGDTEIPANCQLVEVKDDREIRFTVDRGAGDSATLSLR